jgi:hypothetical protein
MASTVKSESEPENEVDPLSTHNEHELLDIKQEEYLVPVVMTETEVCLIPCLAFRCPVSRICVQVGMTPTGIDITLKYIFIN